MMFKHQDFQIEKISEFSRPLEFVGSGSETQPKVGENLN